MSAIDEDYRAIGWYVVTFSQMFAFMRQTMSQRLMRPGDGVGLAELALADANAYQLANSFFAICNAVGKFDDTERKISKWLRARVLERIEERNNIAHGDWLPGVFTHTKATGEQRAVTGLVTTRAAREQSRQVQFLSTDKLNEWAASLERLSAFVGEFGQIATNFYPFAMPGTIRVSDIFVIEGSRREARVLRQGPKAASIKYG